MKKTTLLLAVALCVGLFSGCATNPTTGQRTFDADRTATILRTILPPAVKIAIAKEPQAAPWILDAKVAVCALIDTDKVAPADLKSAIASTGIKEIQTPEIQAVIESAFAVYSAAYSDAVSKHLEPEMKTVLEGFCDGLNGK
jgi:hypothetical protein